MLAALSTGPAPGSPGVLPACAQPRFRSPEAVTLCVAASHMPLRWRSLALGSGALRVIRSTMKFSAVVAAGVAHDAVVVADAGRERVHARGRQLVGRIGLAQLERAPVAGEAEEAVARSERALDLVVRARARQAAARCRSDIDLRLEL